MIPASLPTPVRARLRAEPVAPNFDALGGSASLPEIVGALMTIVLIFAVATLIVSTVVWTICSATGNYQVASRAKAGFFLALGTAVLAGATVSWMNFLLQLGQSLTR